MNQAMPDYILLSTEWSTNFASGMVLDSAVIGPGLRVNVGVGLQESLSQWR